VYFKANTADVAAIALRKQVGIKPVRPTLSQHDSALLVVFQPLLEHGGTQLGIRDVRFPDIANSANGAPLNSKGIHGQR
jgi:hypothetical protein